MPYYAAGAPFARRLIRKAHRRQWSTLMRRIAKAQSKVAKRSFAARFIPSLKLRLR